jgi:hypothetical protein
MTFSQLTRELNKSLSAIEAQAPLTSLKEIKAKEELDKTVQTFLNTLQQCQTVLTKRKSTEAELDHFFSSKGIHNQSQLLRFYQREPDEIAAYFASGKEVVPINAAEVFEWLVANAASLSAERIEEVVQAAANRGDIRMDITLSVEGREFKIDRLKAAALCINLENLDLQGRKAASFALIVRWINTGEVPRLAGLTDAAFNDLQDLLNDLALCDTLGGAVCEETIRRYKLNFSKNSLILRPGDEEKIPKLHLYFRKSIGNVEIVAGEIPLHPFVNLKSLTVNPSAQFNPVFLRDLRCKIEIAGESFPKGIAKYTTRLINFVVQEVEDWKCLPALSCLERVVVRCAMDRSCLRTLNNLIEIDMQQAPLGDGEVASLCRHNSKLKLLKLPKAAIGKEGFSSLAALEELKELQIGFAKEMAFCYKPKEKHYFKMPDGFQALEKLSIFGGALTSRDLGQLGKLPHLKVLDISQCTVDDFNALIDLLNSGQLTLAKVPTTQNSGLGNYYNRYVNTTTEVIF